MSRRNKVTGAVLATGLVVTSGGWFLSANAGFDEQFSACHFEGDTLVLQFIHGANQRVAPSLDVRGDDLVVSLRTQPGRGLSPAIGLGGEARFGLMGGPRTVRYPDGRELECKSVTGADVS